MSSFAMYAIKNGFDPVLAPDHQPWPSGYNPLYDDYDDSSDYDEDDLSGKGKYEENVQPKQYSSINGEKYEFFETFQDAWSFSKSVAPSTVKRDGNGFLVTYK